MMKRRGTAGEAIGVLVNARSRPRGSEPRSDKPAGAYAAKLDQRRKDRLRERQIEAAAAKLTPEQAREALARWAAAGGNGPDMKPHGGTITAVAGKG